MAITNGAGFSVDTLKGPSLSRLQVAEVLFTATGTYDNTAHATLLAVPTLIQNSRNNGKTVTLVGAMCGTPATNLATPTTILGLSSVAVSGANVTFNITTGDFTTELGNITIPTQDRPFMLLVSFTETNPDGTVIGQ